MVSVAPGGAGSGSGEVPPGAVGADWEEWLTV
jgi:hypothetical protein